MEAVFAVRIFVISLFVCCVTAACDQSCSGCTGPSSSDCSECRAGYTLDVTNNECTGSISVSVNTPLSLCSFCNGQSLPR